MLFYFSSVFSYHLVFVSLFRKLLCKSLSALFLPMYSSTCAVLVSFFLLLCLCVFICLRAQSYAERLRLGLAVMHGEAHHSESDMADGRHSPPLSRTTTGHTGLELPCKMQHSNILNWSLLIVFRVCFVLTVICKGGVVQVKTFLFYLFGSLFMDRGVHICIVRLRHAQNK